MRTATLIAGTAERWPRARCTPWSCWPGALENGLTANDASLGTPALAHRPAGLAMKLRTWLLRCRAGRWSGVNRPRPCLRGNHAPLGDDGLARRGLGRSCCRSGGSRRLCSYGRCWFSCYRWRGRSFRRGCNNRRRGLRLSGRRRYYHCRWRSGFLNFFLCWRSRWWRDNWRRLAWRRHYHRTLRRRRRRFGSSFFHCCCRLRCHCRRGLRLRRIRRRRFHHGRRPGRRRWMLEFLLPLP
jgi:hypothetical protein